MPTETMQYLAGVFQMEPGGTPEYYHGNQIGTTRFMTGYDDPRPVVTREAVHTAFGELKWTETGSTATRYGYAGAHGYEEGLMPDLFSMGVFPYLHVGARWYDPLTGRFLQRDPIGIAGGLSLYEYVSSSPVRWTDPLGLWNWYDAAKWSLVGAVGGTVIIVLAPEVTVGTLVGACVVTVSSGIGGGLEEGDLARFRLPNRHQPRGNCMRGCHGEPGPEMWPDAGSLYRVPGSGEWVILPEPPPVLPPPRQHSRLRTD